MSNLANQLALAEREEVGRGIRSLLASPLLTERQSAEAFDLVRRRREPITKWFEHYCGWSLTVEPRLGYARLAKVRHWPATSSTTDRPARRLRSSRAPFDRRRYSLLCVLAAELLSSPVTTIGLLADRVVRATATDPVLPSFDTASRAERMAFVDALRLLESFGVVEVIDGATEAFVASAEAKVLYRIDTALLLRLLVAPVGASGLGVPPAEVPVRFDELLVAITREHRYGAVDEEGAGAGAEAGAGDASGESPPVQPRGTSGAAAPVSTAQRNLWLRHSILRRLVDDPVLYFAELAADELAYLASPTGRQLVRKAAEQGGFVLEERAEGLLLVDPDGLATDARFPDDASTARVAALLLLDVVTSAVDGATTERLVADARALLRRFPRWARAYQGDDGPRRLVAEATAVLAGVDLVTTDRAGFVRPRPAAFRYRVAEVRTTRRSAGDAERRAAGADPAGPDAPGSLEEGTA